MPHQFEFHWTPQNVEHLETPFRRIKTPIPAPGTKEVLLRLQKVESRSMQGQLPIVWKSADDFSVFDIGENKYIDFTSTIFVANVGHSNKAIAESIRSSINCNPLISSYAYLTEVRSDYIEKLIDFSGLAGYKAFLLSAGTEATEAVFKLMRMNGQSLGKRKRGIICIEGNWHGRTMGAQMMSSNIAQKRWIDNLDPDIHFIPFPYPWLQEATLNPRLFARKSFASLVDNGVNLETDIAGIMLETFQGWGAVFYPTDYVQEIKKICDEYSIVLAFDEMQSGFGRTSKSFGFEHYSVQPDLLACGKGMGGGVPLSGVIGRPAIMDLPETGNMSSTHSANPLVCSAGLAVLNELSENKLLQKSSELGEFFGDELSLIRDKFPNVVSRICGKGMIYAIHFQDPSTNKPDSLLPSKICQICLQKGVLVVHTGRESIKLGPPLTISKDALKEGIDVISEAIGLALTS